ncbi:MAG: hypothetical protein AAGC88_15215 [Bacteroidota bacterium]
MNHDFLEIWDQIMYLLTPVAAVIGILIYIYLKVKIASAKTLKDKYDVTSQYSVTYLQATHIAFGIAIFFIVNTYNTAVVEKSIAWFFIRMFMGVALGTMHGYVAFLILKYYYPTRLNKKLNKFRYTPRVNEESGKKMRLLSEEEEDEYLDDKMQAEEAVFSVDYDVWIDETTGKTQIEKYQGRLAVEQCDRCGLHTLKLEREEIVTPATETQEGESLKHYKCTYCGRIKRKSMVIPMQQAGGGYAESNGTPVFTPKSKASGIAMVKVEIHEEGGSIKDYEFQNLEEAQRFMKEYETVE